MNNSNPNQSKVVMKTLSIAVPVYNEESNIPLLWAEIIRLKEELSQRYNLEVVITDNHSTDNSEHLLTSMALEYEFLKYIRFSRNFGYQHSILEAFRHCSGDAAVQLDCDLQDPPSIILDFLREWENGAEVVYGIRVERSEGMIINLTRKFFYKLISAISEDDLPQDAGDFRLLSRRVLEKITNKPDANPYIRGAVASVGFKQIGIPYKREPRTQGASKFNFGSLLALALDGIINHSIIPLRFATYFGFFVSMFCLLSIAFYIFLKIFDLAYAPPGFTTQTILILFGISVNAIFLGIIGEYLARIYKQLKGFNRPIIEKIISQGKCNEI